MRAITNFHRLASMRIALLLALAILSLGVAPAGEPPVRNVILLIPDGMSPAIATAARLVKSGKTAETLNGDIGTELNLDDICVGAVRTYSQNSLITDSAAAGTAYATGSKTNNGIISMDPQKRPLKTLLELAEQQGKSTGLVATSRLSHATPASFASHVPNRGQEADIAQQLVDSGAEVLLGGGRRYFTMESEAPKKTTLLEAARSKGYTYVETAAAMDKADGPLLLGLFSDSHMAFDIDRAGTRQPSLAEMTQKALDILSKNDKGFFLMVEGSRIDHAAHANDVAGAIGDALAFDRAIKVALDFAGAHRDTLVVACADHDTGGMTVGWGGSPLNLDAIRRVRASAEHMAGEINADKTNVAEVLKQYAGIDATDDEIEAVRNGGGNAIGEVLSRHEGIGWTSHGHTGTDILLYAYGPVTPSGILENTEVAEFIYDAMAQDLPIAR